MMSGFALMTLLSSEGSAFGFHFVGSDFVLHPFDNSR